MNYPLHANKSKQYHTIYGLKEHNTDFLLTEVLEFHIIELPLFKEQFLLNDYETNSPEEFWWLLLTAMNRDNVNEVYYNKIEELISGGDDLMAKVLQSWKKMSKEEAERYWKEGIGQELAYYDANIEKDKEIYIKEEALIEMIKLGLPVEQMKQILKLEDDVFNILYNRNKK